MKIRNEIINITKAIRTPSRLWICHRNYGVLSIRHAKPQPPNGISSIRTCQNWHVYRYRVLYNSSTRDRTICPSILPANPPHLTQPPPPTLEALHSLHAKPILLLGRQVRQNSHQPVWKWYLCRPSWRAVAKGVVLHWDGQLAGQLARMHWSIVELPLKASSYGLVYIRVLYIYLCKHYFWKLYQRRI